ncbi:MAG: nicotinate-nucleotide--dimethylbenzimidazole phosphoribosyltransferase [Thiotrichales bacterium]|nr:nicotinate-nucleotide--dimethylbenzimidazole phosphoribosyltransferase [Thiotrichales bacterium]
MCGAFLRATQLGIPILVDGMIASTALWIADMLSRNDQLGQNPDAEAVLQLGKYSLPERHFCTCGSLPRVVDWCFFAHQSAEPAHAIILNALGVEPLLQLELRLGEASGAALALPLLQQACILHAQMATFEQAGVPRAD